MIDYVYFLAWYPICIDDVQCSCFFFFIFFITRLILLVTKIIMNLTSFMFAQMEANPIQ